MKRLAGSLAGKITANRDLRKPSERSRVGIIESWVGLGGNLFLVLLKLTFGLLTNSLALIADAVHSASDIFSSLVVLIGFVMAGKKADSEHPHGHGRTEYLAGLVIGLMLAGAGVAFIYSAYSRLAGDVFANPSIASIAAIIAAILIKEFMYHLSARLGTSIDSETLAGDAWHHRSDSFSSALVLAALIGGYFGLYALDAYLGIAVALLIIYAGFKIARNSCSRLLGAAPADGLQKELIECAREVDGVIDAHNLEIHDYGSWKVITIHIEVSGRLSLDRAHEIAQEVEDQCSSKFHCDTIVHLDPAGKFTS